MIQASEDMTGRGGDITEAVICLVEVVCLCFHWMLVNLWSYIFIHTLCFYIIFLSKHGIHLQLIDVDFFDLFLTLLTIVPKWILMNVIRLTKNKVCHHFMIPFLCFQVLLGIPVRIDLVNSNYHACLHAFGIALYGV